MPNERLDGSIARLKELWTYEGVSQDHVERVTKQRGPWAARAVAEAIQREGDDYHGTLAALREAAAQLGVRDRAVADATLNLSILAGQTSFTKSPVLPKLYADTLQVRRQTLRNNWRQVLRLHNDGEEVQPTVPEPSDSVLRNKVEKEMLRALARVLEGDPEARTAEEAPRVDVLVLGGAVMDIVFRLPDTMPRPNTSVQVRDLAIHPGGKGLSQAVGASRLDLSVAILTAIGSDYFGDQILLYLRKEKVRTDLVRRIQESLSPITGVIQYSDRTSVALGWKNAEDVRLGESDVAKLQDGLKIAQVLLLTFELPPRTINQALETIKRLDAEERPLTIVTPAPPLPFDELDRALLPAIDILVANKWEAAQFVGGSEEDIDALGEEIRRLGIRNVCIPSDGGCYTYKASGLISTPAWPIKQGHESAGERDALCAALAYQLTREGGELDESALVWATAAMARHSLSFQIAAAMPTVDEVETFIATHSVQPSLPVQPPIGDPQ